MVMENEGLASTDWTSTVPHPFGPAPGGAMSGLASTRWTSTVATPFGPAPGGGRLGGVYDSGFAAERVVPPTQVHPDELVLAERFKIQVTRKDTPGNPAMVVSMRYTDKGLLTKSVLDKQVKELLAKSGFRVSKNTLWQRTPVSWRWERSGTIYYPVVASGPLEGLRYAGNAIELPVIDPTDKALAQLPGTIDIYTIAITSKDWSLDDADAARALTLIKQAIINMERFNAYQSVAAVVRGVETSVFDGKASPVAKEPKGEGKAVEPMQAGMVKAGLGVGLLGALALLLLSKKPGEGEVI